jgi:hypothetical protein
MKLEFSQQIFEKKKYLNIEFNQSPSRKVQLFNEDGRTDGRKDGHDKANNRFSQILRTRLRTGCSAAKLVAWLICFLRYTGSSTTAIINDTFSRRLPQFSKDCKDEYFLLLKEHRDKPPKLHMLGNKGGNHYDT